MADEPAPPDDRPHYSVEEVRQGEIILRKRWQRIVFIAGLVGMVLLALVMGIATTL
jgi:hypothetical protein